MMSKDEEDNYLSGHGGLSLTKYLAESGFESGQKLIQILTGIGFSVPSEVAASCEEMQLLWKNEKNRLLFVAERGGAIHWSLMTRVSSRSKGSGSLQAHDEDFKFRLCDIKSIFDEPG